MAAPPFPPPCAAKILSTQFLSPPFPPPCAAKNLSTQFLSPPFLYRINPFPLSIPTSPGRPGRFRIHAASPGPRDPRTPSNQGIVTSLSRVQDKVQILFAVLFWMSLFFWASAWDGRNRSDKGSRFRR